MGAPLILQDTDVLIDLQRKHPAAIAWAESLLDESYIVSGVTAMELAAGSRNRTELQSALRVISQLPIVHLSEQDHERALELLARYVLSSGLSLPDYLIAAQAMQRNCTLMTFNLRHFQVVEGLSCRAPYARAKS